MVSLLLTLLLESVVLSAQSVSLSIAPGSATPGGTVSFDISLTSTGGAHPTALQWTLRYAIGTDNLTVRSAPAALSVSKSVVCSTYSLSESRCLLYGFNATVLTDGPIATVTLQLPATVSGTSSPIQVSDVVSSSGAGGAVSAAGGSGAISLAPAVAVSALSCPAVVTAPGIAACKISLAQPASVAFEVSLQSNDQSVIVPSTIQIPAGQNAATFNAIAAAAVRGRHVIITAASGGASAQATVSVTGGGDSVLLFNAASFSSDQICSSGSVVAAFGSNFTDQTSAAGAGALPVSLGGVQVQVGDPAPLYYVSPTQVNFQCPLVNPGTPIQVNVNTPAGPKPPVSSTAQAVTPGLYAFGPNGTGQGAILIAGTNQLVTGSSNPIIPGRPAQPGEAVSIYGNGFGATDSAWPAGTPAPLDRLLRATSPVRVVIGGIEVEPSFVGLAPGAVGLFQINATVPLFAPGGNSIPVFARVYLDDGRVINTNTVTLAIASNAARPAPSSVAVDPASLAFFGAPGFQPPSQNIAITNGGYGNLTWNAAADSPWISLSALNGGSPGSLGVFVNPSGLAPGQNNGNIAIAPYDASDSIATVPVSLQMGTLLFSDDFSSGSANSWTISPLGRASGWTVANGAYAYDGGGNTQSVAGSSTWTDYVFSVDFQLSSKSNFPGGIRGRLNPQTGTGYAVWIFPDDRTVRLYRVPQWAIDNGGNTFLGQFGIGIDTTNWHNLRLKFKGSQIQVYYDNVLAIQATDSTYTQGAIAFDVSSKPVAFTNVAVIGF